MLIPLPHLIVRDSMEQCPVRLHFISLAVIPFPLFCNKDMHYLIPSFFPGKSEMQFSMVDEIRRGHHNARFFTQFPQCRLLDGLSIIYLPPIPIILSSAKAPLLKPEKNLALLLV